MQSQELRRALNQWVETRVQDLENDGARIEWKEITHIGNHAEVTVSFTVPNSALGNE